MKSREKKKKESWVCQIRDLSLVNVNMRTSTNCKRTTKVQRNVRSYSRKQKNSRVMNKKYICMWGSKLFFFSFFVLKEETNVKCTVLNNIIK